MIGKHRRPPQTNDLLITEPAAFRPGAFFGQAYRLKQQFEMVARPRFEPIIRQVSEFRRTIGGNIADLRRVGKSGSGLSLPNFSDFARFPSICCDPLRAMVALVSANG